MTGLLSSFWSVAVSPLSVCHETRFFETLRSGAAGACLQFSFLVVVSKQKESFLQKGGVWTRVPQIHFCKIPLVLFRFDAASSCGSHFPRPHVQTHP